MTDGGNDDCGLVVCSTVGGTQKRNGTMTCHISGFISNRHGVDLVSSSLQNPSLGEKHAMTPLLTRLTCQLRIPRWRHGVTVVGSKVLVGFQDFDEYLVRHWIHNMPRSLATSIRCAKFLCLRCSSLLHPATWTRNDRYRCCNRHGVQASTPTDGTDHVKPYSAGRPLQEWNRPTTTRLVARIHGIVSSLGKLWTRFAATLQWIGRVWIQGRMPWSMP